LKIQVKPQRARTVPQRLLPITIAPFPSSLGEIVMVLKPLTAVLTLIALSASANAQTALTSGEWQLEWMREAPIRVIDTARTPTIRFDGQRIAGTASCNRYFGGYTSKGADMSFSAIGKSKMACLDGMETETAFLSTLRQVRGHRLANGKLDLLDEKGAPASLVNARQESRAPVGPARSSAIAVETARWWS
jgi:heat shock protein HslJ